MPADAVSGSELRQSLVAAAYGFVAGIAAALVLLLMGFVSKLVWSGSGERWYIFAVVIAGGVIIAILRHWHSGVGLSDQLEAARTPHRQKLRDAFLLALMAIVAVGFGGAVGPEAGILAVIAEMSALITILIARNRADERLIGEAGAAGALGGLYGSPPGAAVLAQEHPEAPKWQIYLAAVAGLMGFLLASARLLPDNPLRIALPDHVAPGDGTDMLWALLPSILGAAMGLAFAFLLPGIQRQLDRIGNVMLATIAGSALFAALVTAFPILRFSGHHEIAAMLAWGETSGVASLLALGLLKALALALCLASGWRGGAAFPLLFAGAAAGAAATWVLPDMPVAVALAAGMTAAVTAGLGKPIAAMLIAILLIGATSIGPLCVGGLIGWGASRLVSAPKLH